MPRSSPHGIPLCLKTGLVALNCGRTVPPLWDMLRKGTSAHRLVGPLFISTVLLLGTVRFDRDVGEDCPGLRRRIAPDRRRGHGDARLRARPLQGGPAYPREAVVPGLRYHLAAPAPDHAIARGRAGACLLAHQAEIFAPRGRQPGNLHLIRLGLARLLRRWAPLVDALAAEVVASDILHVDDTLASALAPGTGRPRPADYGLTSATSGPLRVSAHWRRCSSTRRIAKTSIRRPT